MSSPRLDFIIKSLSESPETADFPCTPDETGWNSYYLALNLNIKWKNYSMLAQHKWLLS